MKHVVDKPHLDFFFDGPPDPDGGRLVEMDDASGHSVAIRSWFQRGDGRWVLRISPAQVRQAFRPRRPSSLQTVAPAPTVRFFAATVTDRKVYGPRLFQRSFHPPQAHRLRCRDLACTAPPVARQHALLAGVGRRGVQRFAQEAPPPRDLERRLATERPHATGQRLSPSTGCTPLDQTSATFTTPEDRVAGPAC